MNRRGVLVIDRSATATTALAALLEDAGYDVRVAKSVRDGRELMARFAAAVVVCELQPMGPSVDAIQTMFANLRDPPQIVFCAVGDEPPRCNGSLVLKKPIDIDTLLAAVAGLADSPKSTQAA